MLYENLSETGKLMLDYFLSYFSIFLNASENQMRFQFNAIIGFYLGLFI